MSRTGKWFERKTFIQGALLFTLTVAHVTWWYMWSVQEHVDEMKTFLFEQ